MKLSFGGFSHLSRCISIVLIFAVLLISGGCGFKSEFEYESDWDEPSVTKPLDPTSYLSDTRDEAWRSDLKYMEDNLRAFHGDLFYEMSEQDFDNAVSKLHDSIPSLTDNEIIIELSRILAMIGDAHTRLIRLINSLLAPVDPSHPLSEYFQYPELSFRTYPLRAYWFTDGLFVVGSTREHADLLREGVRETVCST